MKNPILIRPRFCGGFADDYFLKEVPCVLERAQLCFQLSGVGYIQCGLNIVFLCADVYNFVYYITFIIQLFSF